MGHAHAHGHDHSGHDHSISPDADQRKLALALGLIVAFMAAEVVAAIVASSLALFSDAAHMLTDAAAIALALFAARLAARPAKGALTFGLGRAEILAAQFNGATLVVLGAIIAIEALRRLFDPPPVEGAIVIVVALIGIPVNLAAMKLLASAERRSLNVEGAYQHILTDLFAFIATAIAGAAVLWLDFREADAVASLIVAALMLRSAYGLLLSSGRVFLEAAPGDMNVDEIGTALASFPRVVEIHDLHVWEVTSGFPALSAHVTVVEHQDCHEIREQLETVLRERFGITHTTLQVDHRRSELLTIEGT
ncbi:MAG TPA: cation diffusion facilitator family transporter [Baekduia sp.]|nr:cation diffusion facilitator family transporter [Baekduia sp.]